MYKVREVASTEQKFGSGGKKDQSKKDEKDNLK